MKVIEKALLCLSVAIAVGACTPAQQASTETVAPTVAEQKIPMKSGIITENMDLSVKPGTTGVRMKHPEPPKCPLHTPQQKI